ISTLMDIDEFIRYSMLQIYYYNGDWPGNNIKYWRSTVPFEKWRWILYDTDFGFGLWDFNKVYHRTLDFATTAYGEDWPNPPWSTYLLRRLLQNEEFKHRFINTFADHLNTTLLPDSLIRRIDFQSNEIAAEMSSHIQRWGGYYSNWTRNVNDMRRFANSRPYRMELDILQFFKISSTRGLNLGIAGCDNATIRVNTIGIKQFPWSGNYFDKIPIELIAIPPEGYRFVRWEGNITSDSPLIKPKMDANQNLTAVFEPISPEYKTGVVINEVFYKGNLNVNCDDWVELYNLSKDYMDISDWEINDNSNNKNFRFLNPTILSPQEYLVVSRDKAAFKTYYPHVENITGNLNFGFSSEGDCIRLFNHRGEIIDSVCFSSSYPWPSEPNGLGYSLSLYDPESDNSVARNWYVSKSIGGTPGTANLLNQTDDFPVLINLRAYPNPFTDYIRIEIDLPSPGYTELSVTDLNGRTLFILFNEFWTAGNKHFDWSPGHLPSGIYLLKLRHSEGIVTMKLVK
ncbi:MAG: CotH kinase family protein, partial [Bacteroidales bacterium]|nr:CotH kinase family protein [Bacteroidales bacterium]